jgi:MSHA biogenesis protein MshM
MPPLSRLARQAVVTAYLPNPYLDPQTLFIALAELGQPLPANTLRYHLLKRLTNPLLDYAQMISASSFAGWLKRRWRAWRRCACCQPETEKRKLLQVVMFGQPGGRKLADPSVRQLRQHRLPLPRAAWAGVADYLNHRLRVAGCGGACSLTPL